MGETVVALKISRPRLRAAFLLRLFIILNSALCDFKSVL